MKAVNTYISDIEITNLVQKRVEYRLNRDYEAADEIKKYLESLSIEIEDFPYISGGESCWRRLVNFKPVEVPNSIGIMELASQALQSYDNPIELYDIVSMTKKQLYSIMKCDENKNYELLSNKELDLSKREMQGRKFVDCAVKFAFAGVNDPELFHLLEAGIRSELKRFGIRKSCRDIDILQLIEKLALSGVTNSSVYILAAELLESKKANVSNELIEKLSKGYYNLLDDRPLLWLWRYASRQSKAYYLLKNQNISETIPVNTEDLSLLFENNTLPLYVDLGCGFGVSNIALANVYNNSKNINILGCDLSRQALQYSKSIAERWNLSGNCKFINTDTYNCLKLIKNSYPGPVVFISINFPTPFSQSLLDIKADEDLSNGNTQLPSSFEDFMVTNQVIDLCGEIFDSAGEHSSNTKSCPVNLPGFFIQSNIEDIAVKIKQSVESSSYFKKTGEKKGFFIPEINEFDQIWKTNTPDNIIKSNNIEHWDIAPSICKSRRQMIWSESGRERPYGRGWLPFSILPKTVKSETEAECLINGKPIHRIFFGFTKNK